MKPENLNAIKKFIARAEHATKAGSREVRFTADEVNDVIRDITRLTTLIAEETQYNLHLQKMLQQAQKMVQTSMSSGRDAGTF